MSFDDCRECARLNEEREKLYKLLCRWWDNADCDDDQLMRDTANTLWPGAISEEYWNDENLRALAEANRR